jgi:hypothetical protein
MNTTQCVDNVLPMTANVLGLLPSAQRSAMWLSVNGLPLLVFLAVTERLILDKTR